MTRRMLLIGGRSLASNEFALGIDAETDTMVLYRMVSRGRKMSVLAGAHTPCTVPVAMMDALFLAFQAPEPAR